MNRSLDELTASELNAAIDDTNFPKALSTPCSPLDNVDESNAQQNGKENQATKSVNRNDDNANDAEPAKDDQHSTDSLPPNVQNGIKGFIKRAHPAPLKMVAFKGESIDLPGTPRTPRTSTTPGMCANKQK